MKAKYFYILLVFLLLSFGLTAQNSIQITGKVVDTQNRALTGALVFWENSDVTSITDAHGHFSIQTQATSKKLIASFVGYENDTILLQNIPASLKVTFKLKQGVALQKVEIVGTTNSTLSSSLTAQKTLVMTQKELHKGACCNLSESFETNPSIDVSFTDAVSGTKQIQMLGLASPYIQITRENIPDIYGLSAIQGLNFVPGTWIKSIHINKGAGSVVNGYESITGQIDVNLQDPFSMDTLFVNMYANPDGRYEVNTHHRYKINDSLATAFLFHAKTSVGSHDKNHDSFLDIPVGDQIITLNRWEYNKENGSHAQFGIKGTYLTTTAGQTDFTSKTIRDTLNPWGHTNTIQRIDGWAKAGKPLSKKGFSMGLQAAGIYHLQNSIIGITKYDAEQSSLYANYILQGGSDCGEHQYKFGGNIKYDRVIESFANLQFNRVEFVPGAYAEYTYFGGKSFTLIAGLRGDYHNEYKFFATPRLHLRYAPTKSLTLRASGGRGLRTANIFAENSHFFASSRKLEIIKTTNYGYGLLPEIAWNFGGNATKTFRLWYRNGSISLDAYRTWFENQTIVDFVTNAQAITFYNLNGASFSNSIQTQVDYELHKNLNVRLAYRWYDVQTSYANVLQKKPFVSNHRAFINFGYESKKHWKFDYTINWQSEKSIPYVSSEPNTPEVATKSPSFFIMNAQISKVFKKAWDVYVGAENLLNYKQEHPIISASEPYSKTFDSSLIWGPVMGREIYVGLRYKM